MASNNKPGKRLFIGSLPYKFTEGELLSLFIPEGKIVAVRVMHNKWGKSRGMGYVEFENEADAIRAKEKFHNYHLDDRSIIVDYAQPDPFLTEEGKQRHLEAQARRGKKSKTKHLRQTVFESRHFGAHSGAKFANRNKKRK